MTFVPLTRERHGHLSLKRFTDYAFARGNALLPLTAAELPRAVLCLPIAFVEQERSFVPVAVVGVQPGQSLYITPDGRWAAPYVPAALRGHPFMLARSGDSLILCIDEDSGLLGTDGDAGPLFGEDGNPTPAVRQVLDFLTQVEGNRAATQVAVDTIARHGLLEPWPIKLAGADGAERRIEGLYRIREAALRNLSGQGLAEVQAAGGLAIAYGQLFAMGNLGNLGQLLQFQARLAAAPAPEPTFQLPESDTIDFNW